MRLQQVLLSVVASAVILGTPLFAIADDDGGPPVIPRNELCKENPGKCDEARAKRQEFCKANPETCKEQRQKMQSKRAERQEFCKANPEKCEEQREQIKAKRAEIEAKCEADPAKCDELKEEARKKMQGWLGGPPSPPPVSKPNPQPVD